MRGAATRLLQPWVCRIAAALAFALSACRSDGQIAQYAESVFATQPAANAVEPLPRDPNQPPAPTQESNGKSPAGKAADTTQSGGEKSASQDENQDTKREKNDQGEKGKEEKDNNAKDKDESPKEDSRFGEFAFTDRNGFDWYSCHGQATVISQSNGPFRSPYEGPHSFLSQNDTAVSETATLFLGARLGPLGELYCDPEISAGRGLSDVFGLGAQPNGDITRVGRPEPTPYIARLWMQRDFALGSEQQKVESDVHQLGGYRYVSRITVAVGKMAATDWFDNNAYSHDPRTQFMNWALMYNGAWDYPADVRGYTWGGVVEWNEESFALRGGVFAENLVANGSELDPNFAGANSEVVEFEQRYKLGGRPGKARWMAYHNTADMGSYQDALAAAPVNPEVNAVATYHTPGKTGLCLNLEQEFTDDVGGFLRLGWNDGQTETWSFTEIDQTIALGVVIKGTGWCRPQDQFGLGVALNGISAEHAAYLAAGGLGFELGDGRLACGPESAIETYYRWQMSKHFWLTPDLQLIENPGYNTDRGPIFIAGARAHAEF